MLIFLVAADLFWRGEPARWKKSFSAWKSIPDPAALVSKCLFPRHVVSELVAVPNPLDVPAYIDCVVFSAVFGDQDRTVKSWGPALAAAPNCRAFVFTEEPVTPELAASAKANHFEIRTDTYHLHDPCMQPIPFARAKYYKLQGHRLLPPHVKYFFWTDATSHFFEPQGLVYAQHRLKTHASVMTLVHGGLGIMGEFRASIPRYGAMGVMNNLTAMVLGAVTEGYCDLAWRADPGYNVSRPFPPDVEPEREVTVPIPLNCSYAGKVPSTNTYHGGLGPVGLEDGTFEDSLREAVLARCEACGDCRSGNAKADADEVASQIMDAFLRPPTCRVASLYEFSGFVNAPDAYAGAGTHHTAIVAADLTRPRTREFFDIWWEQTCGNWQDQVTVTYAAWKVGLRIGKLYGTCYGSHHL
ncbi:hypothetical protein DIPPA_08860 [Diplonema papillatum]|nr:hypothetical protein DIPPA_08860 [Diplonema papillatum]